MLYLKNSSPQYLIERPCHFLSPVPWFIAWLSGFHHLEIFIRRPMVVIVSKPMPTEQWLSIIFIMFDNLAGYKILECPHPCPQTISTVSLSIECYFGNQLEFCLLYMWLEFSEILIGFVVFLWSPVILPRYLGVGHNIPFIPPCVLCIPFICTVSWFFVCLLIYFLLPWCFLWLYLWFPICFVFLSDTYHPHACCPVCIMSSL